MPVLTPRPVFIDDVLPRVDLARLQAISGVARYTAISAWSKK
jgi:hypothetical protein